MKVEVAIQGSPTLILIVRTVSVDVKQRSTNHELLELRSCVKVGVAVLGSPSLIGLIVSMAVDVKQH